MSERYPSITAHDLAQSWEDGYSEGVQRVAAYEGILTDLIAELRDTGPLESDWHRVEAMFEAVRRAEARLREVTGSDDRPCTAALNIAGKHYPCDTEVLGGGTHRGWPHSNKKAEAIWQGVDDV